MRLLLARHGNTFGPGQTVVWAGTRNDLPLVEHGREQAASVAAALAAQHVQLQAVYCGPLTRTRAYAEIITERLGLMPPITDARLSEIDYGDWTGLTHDEVIARFGAACVAAWDERAEWPATGRWGGSAAQMQAQVHTFAQDIVTRHAATAQVLVVSSSGTLRYFATLEPAAFATRQCHGRLKVKTGNLCELTYDGRFTVQTWDITPSALLLG